MPPEITAALEPIKDNDEAVRAYGVELGAQMCTRIMASGVQGALPSPGLRSQSPTLRRRVPFRRAVRLRALDAVPLR